MALFNPISWKITSGDNLDLHGKEVNQTKLDFFDKKSAKEFIQRELDKLTCEGCGGQRIKGGTLDVELRYVRLYRQETVDGWFGEKRKDINFKSVYRIIGSHLDGEVTCKSCKRSTTSLPSENFPLVSLYSVGSFVNFLNAIPVERRDKFIKEHLTREAIERPHRMKEVLQLAVRWLEGAKDAESRNNKRATITSLATVCATMLDGEEADILLRSFGIEV
ncbi:hypothetical protein [Pseudaestuariivita atlantica]|uniref:hypothetical protein n=1 Tax=Pseudaestuariivita atlantica TaxID=1317121 RepID=UPI00106B055B|nr:hypothetical protein [Pseudaestuariivita atlantica]